MLKKIAIAIVSLVVLIQLLPYGRNHTNPPIMSEPSWDSPETRATFRRACIDCHSYETRWPWYSHVAPASWFLQWHVEKGRGEFNVSHWGTGENEADEAAENVREREMPLRSYLWIHSDARLTDAERTQFAAGLAATFGDKGGGDGEQDDD